ncbi:MAG TPA: WhiB family transcriptional regulator [Candidatus Dietzia merdigallinarum]|nr:WhiB family transcriptional regulator [Candidatus Dietzia merdigallinarum]
MSTAPINPEISKARRLAMAPSFAVSMAPPGPWAADAACGGRWGLFDPRDTRETKDAFQARVRAAEAICSACPVLQDCRSWTEGTPRAKVAGVLAGHYFGRVVAGQPGFHSRRTTFPVDRPAAA